MKAILCFMVETGCLTRKLDGSILRFRILSTKRLVSRPFTLQNIFHRSSSFCRNKHFFSIQSSFSRVFFFTQILNFIDFQGLVWFLIILNSNSLIFFWFSLMKKKTRSTQSCRPCKTTTTTPASASDRTSRATSIGSISSRITVAVGRVLAWKMAVKLWTLVRWNACGVASSFTS